MTPKTRPHRKKPYRSPRLVAYGDLRRLTTLVVKGSNKGDAPGAPATKSCL